MNIIDPVSSIIDMTVEPVTSFINKNIFPVTSFLGKTIEPLTELASRTISPIASLINKTIKVPEDLSSITTIKADQEVDPYDAGMTKDGVKAIWARVEDLYRTGIYPGVGFCMRRRGKVILNRAIGHARGNGPDEPSNSEKILLTPDTPICQFSASKAITAMLIHLLVERKAIDLLDPVCHYIPEFAQHGKEHTSIYHIISHHGGIPKPPPDTDPEILFDHQAFVKLLCDSKPESKGGRRQAYHAVTGGTILGEIIRRVTGLDIREFLYRTIKKPLGLKYFNYGLEEEDIHKIAINYVTGPPLIYPFSSLAKRALSVAWEEVVRISNEPRFLRTIVPAANLVATTDEMSKFFQLMLNGGELDGVRIFEPLSIKRSIMESDNIHFDGTMVIPMRYSAGLMLGASPVGLWGPYTQSAYGHIGFMNIFCWADPKREIAISLQTTGKSLIGPHILPLARLLAYISWYCRPGGLPGEITEAYTSFILPIQQILQRSLMAW